MGTLKTMSFLNGNKPKWLNYILNCLVGCLNIWVGCWKEGRGGGEDTCEWHMELGESRAKLRVGGSHAIIKVIWFQIGIAVGSANGLHQWARGAVQSATRSPPYTNTWYTPLKSMRVAIPTWTAPYKFFRALKSPIGFTLRGKRQFYGYICSYMPIYLTVDSYFW